MVHLSLFSELSEYNTFEGTIPPKITLLSSFTHELQALNGMQKYHKNGAYDIGASHLKQ